MKHVTLITDGACNPNPGRGGWAAILRYGSAWREIHGCVENTTNNLMELTAIVEGMRRLKEPCAVTVRTDSRTAIAWCGPKAFKKQKQRTLYPRALALVQEYRRLTINHEITFEWVKGHGEDADNNRADFLAESQCRRPF